MACEDIISKLPTDILISIISLLGIREITATSIVSKHWRHLHCYVTHINFPKFIWTDSTTNQYQLDLSKHQSMINHVLNSYRGGRIKLFKVDMSFVKDDKCERRFEFVLTKKAETIHILGVLSMSLEFLRLPNTIFLHSLGCIKDLSLYYISASDQDFELLVSNCLDLESLTVVVSYNLKNVSIVGLSKLKQLKLTDFVVVESIVIRDTISLVYLTLRYLSGHLRLSDATFVQLSNTPKLTELNYEEGQGGKFNHVGLLSGMSSCIRDQLQRLCLAVAPYRQIELLNFYVKFVNIKYLKLDISLRKDRDFYALRCVCCLVEACRSLETLVIKLPRWPYKHATYKANTYNEPRCELSLKYLEITGYVGYSSERELALYLINSARALQELAVLCIHEHALDCAHRDFRHIKLARVSFTQMN